MQFVAVLPAPSLRGNSRQHTILRKSGGSEQCTRQVAWSMELDLQKDPQLLGKVMLLQPYSLRSAQLL